MTENPEICATKNNSDSEYLVSIPYSTAILQPPKKGQCGHIFVTWEGAPEKIKTVLFATLGAVEVVARPKLPCGYYMEWHDSWVLLADRIYDKERDSNASFEQLDIIVKDCEIFKEQVCGIYYDIPVYDDRNDYLERCANVSSANQKILSSMLLSIELTFQNTVDEQSRPISSIKKVLLLMFPTLSETDIKLIENTLKERVRHRTIETNKQRLDSMLVSMELTFNNSVIDESKPISSVAEALQLMFPPISETSVKAIEATLKKYNK